MKIKLLRNIIYRGKPTDAGSIVDVEPYEASAFIGMRLAELVAEPETQPVETATSAQAETATGRGKRSRGK